MNQVGIEVLNFDEPESESGDSLQPGYWIAATIRSGSGPRRVLVGKILCVDSRGVRVRELLPMGKRRVTHHDDGDDDYIEQWMGGFDYWIPWGCLGACYVNTTGDADTLWSWVGQVTEWSRDIRIQSEKEAAHD